MSGQSPLSSSLKAAEGLGMSARSDAGPSRAGAAQPGRRCPAQGSARRDVA